MPKVTCYIQCTKVSICIKSCDICLNYVYLLCAYIRVISIAIIIIIIIIIKCFEMD